MRLGNFMTHNHLPGDLQVVKGKAQWEPGVYRNGKRPIRRQFQPLVRMVGDFWRRLISRRDPICIKSWRSTGSHFLDFGLLGAYPDASGEMRRFDFD
jgi:hypothetical protein